jgi:glutathione S-transferase
MITIYGIKKIFADGIGETKDLRIQWALEELELPYRFHGLDQTVGELDNPEYGKINCFHQIPTIDDDGYILTESAAILLYLAEKTQKLIPSDFEGRMRVTQWSFAAVSTVAPTLNYLEMLPQNERSEQRTFWTTIAHRWLSGLENRLEGREWIATKEFTVADILQSHVLRGIRKMHLLENYPRLKGYYTRCMTRPAWERTLELSARRLGVSVNDIR